MQTEPNLLSLFRQLSFARLWLSASRRRPLVISRSAEDTCNLCSRLIGKFVARSNNRPNCLSNTYFIKPLRCNNAAKVLLFPETTTTPCAKRFAYRAKNITNNAADTLLLGISAALNSLSFHEDSQPTTDTSFNLPMSYPLVQVQLLDNSFC